MESINILAFATVVLVSIVAYFFLAWQLKVSIKDLEKEMRDRQLKREIAEYEQCDLLEKARRIKMRCIIDEAINEKLKEMQKNKRRKNKPITNKN